MNRLYNYIGYCTYSFLPLYLFMLFYNIIFMNLTMIFISVILILLSILFLIWIFIWSKTNIFVCDGKEISNVSIIDIRYFLFFLLITMFLIIKFDVLVLPFIVLSAILILYRLDFVFLSYVLIILGYKAYNIRGKLVYSKKSFNELMFLLKTEKYLEIKEISNNIYLEDKKHSLKRLYCL